MNLPTLSRKSPHKFQDVVSYVIVISSRTMMLVEVEQPHHYFENRRWNVCMSFKKRLQELGVYAPVRRTRGDGDEESAACGQLATSRSRKGKKEDLEAAI